MYVIIPQINFLDFVKSTFTSKFIASGYVAILLLVVLSLYRLLLCRDHRNYFSKLDLLLALLFIYLIGNKIFFQDSVGFSLRFGELFILLSTYLVLRNVQKKYCLWLLMSIIVAGIVQAVYGNLQLLGYCPSHHSGFKMTGSFFNPGPYAGFLASVWTLAMGIYLFRKDIQQLLKELIQNNRVYVVITVGLKIILVMSFIGTTLVLPASLSRSAWTATGISSLLLLEIRSKNFKNVLCGFSFLRKQLLLAVLIVFLVLSAIGLYSLKKESSEGRLLVWKVSSGIVADFPFFGVGFDNFNKHYMNYQEAYFADGNTAKFGVMHADNNNYAFNDLLQFTVENGFVGLVLLVLVMVQIVRIKTSHPLRFMMVVAKVSCFCIGVFALFSYPVQILPIKLIFVLCLAILSGFDKKIQPPRAYEHILKNSYLKAIVCFLVLGVCFKTFGYTNNLKKGFNDWKTALRFYHMRDYESAVQAFEKTSFLFERNGVFLMNFGKALSMNQQHYKAIIVLNEAQKYTNNTVIEMALGMSYEALKKYRLAEDSYQKAANMIPSKFLPNYLLAKLYEESNQHAKAIAKAKELLKKEVKINSMAIEEIKEEALKILSKKVKTSGF